MVSVVLVETDNLSSRSSSLPLLPRIDSDFWRLNLPRGTVPRVARWEAARPEVDVAFSAPLADRFRLVPAPTKVLDENIITSSSGEEGGEGWWEVTGVGNWDDWDEGNCLEGRRRRFMRRGTRATREEGGEGERGEGREDSLSLWLLVEKPLLLVAAAAVWAVFLRLVCLDRAIPVQRWGATLGVSLSHSPRRLEIDFTEENPLILYVHRYASRSEESARARDVLVGDFCWSLSESAACSTFPKTQTTENNG